MMKKTAAILIVDGMDQQASTRFESEVRPGLTSGVDVEVVEGASRAKECLQARDYGIVVVEHMVTEPVSLQLPPADPAKIQELLDQGGKVRLPLAGLNLSNIDDVIRPAYKVLPDLFPIRPKAGYIIVSHGKGVGTGKQLPKYQAFPQVLGVFGWISSKGTPERILTLIRKRLA
jgi:hypothetical protein